MNTTILIPTVLMLILLSSLTFKRINVVREDHGTLALLQPKGRVAVMGICLTVSYVLLIPPIYLGMETLMPLSNGTDLLSKYFSLVAVALLGGHLAEAYQSQFALRWTTGTPGAVAFGVGAVGLFVTLLASDVPNPSPQLLAYADQPGVKWQTFLVLLYVAYFVATLIPATYRDARTNLLRTHRIGSALICVGFVMSVGRALTYPIEVAAGAEDEDLFMLISYVSTAFVVIGLAVFAYARRTRKPIEELTIDTSIE